MIDRNLEDDYGDGDIPEVDLPQDNTKKTSKEDYENVEPLPGWTRRGIGSLLRSGNFITLFLLYQ